MEFHTNLQNLYNELCQESKLDSTDWTFAMGYAKRWKLSVADALIELYFIDETTLAKCLARVHHLVYVPGCELKYDFTEVSLENFDDLMNVCAAPLIEHRLAICNPYDDHHGYLDSHFCRREMVVTERSAVTHALQRHGVVGLRD